MCVSKLPKTFLGRLPHTNQNGAVVASYQQNENVLCIGYYDDRSEYEMHLKIDESEMQTKRTTMREQ